MKEMTSKAVDTSNREIILAFFQQRRVCTPTRTAARFGMDFILVEKELDRLVAERRLKREVNTMYNPKIQRPSDINRYVWQS